MRIIVQSFSSFVSRKIPKVLSVNRIAACIIVFCIVIGMCNSVCAAATNEFRGHWAEEALTEWAKLGLLKGDSNGNYNPDGKITRAEFMALVNRVMNYTAKSSSIRKYTDVSADRWYYDDASRALAAGYITGTSANTLSPEDTITREQAITIISRIRGIEPNGDTGILSLAADSSAIASWARGPVAGAIREGLVTGSNGRINPRANTTRSEAITLLDRVRTDTRMYNFAGTYGPESGTATVGNVVIASPGIRLRNLTVTGNIEITDAVGEGEATLDNVVVHGKIIAKGGKPKIIAANTDAGGDHGNGGTGSGIPAGGGTPGGGGNLAGGGIPGGGGTPGGGGIPSGGGIPGGGESGGGNNSGGNSSDGSGEGSNPAGGHTLAVSAVNGYVTVNPKKAAYQPGETVELFTRPAPGYSFKSWSGDLSGNRLRETIVMDGNKSVTAVFDTWTPPIGIPAPEFGVLETYRMYDAPAKRNPGLTYHQNSEGGYYTHYVDNKHPNATDKNNTYGTADKPRLTLPGAASVLPGSVVEFHGGPYTLNYTIYRVDGTAELPIFIRGFSQTERVALNGGDLYLNSSYLIFENFSRTDDVVCVRSFTDRQAHNICVRNCDTAGLSALSWDGGESRDIVFYGNYNNSNSFDPNAGAFNERDGGGIGINLGSNRIWIIDNHITLAGGDASGAGHAARYTAQNYYIGRNIMHTCGENAIDVKEVDTVIVSQNIMYDFQGWSSGSDGTAIVLHYGPTYSPKNVWLLHNEIFDCGNTAIQVGGDQQYPVYIIGNIIYDIKNGAGTGKAFTTWNCNEVYLSNNVMYNTDNGVDWGVPLASAKLFFNNNIISNISDAGYALRVEATNQRQSAEISANLFYQPGGSARILWGSANYTIAQLQQIEGKGAGSIEADPMFVSPQKYDFRLQTGSPAIDKGQDDEIYQVFQDRFGIDIRRDSYGNLRPQGSGWDIGAFEHAGNSNNGGDSGSGGDSGGNNDNNVGGTPGSPGSPESPRQKTYYIRQRASGANNGSDWTNAWTKLPDVLERGATYYIASGTYPVYRFDDPELGNAYITIKKATDSEHGTDDGWNKGYGPGTALFTGEKGPIFEFTTGYYIIDGQTGQADSGHGIKLYNPMNIEPLKGGTCMLIQHQHEVRHLTLRHIEMQDAGWAGTAKDDAYITRTVLASGTTSHIEFQYCYIHDSGQEWMLFAKPDSDFLIEHCYFKNGGSGSSAYHSVGIWHRGEKENMNIHIRYNTFENFAKGGGTGYISLGYRGDPDIPTYSSGYYIYGNIFKETSPLAGPSRAIGSNGANGGPFLSDVKIFNNTFYRMKNNSTNITLANKADNNLAANNIWYESDRVPAFSNIDEMNNIKNDLTYDPFIDAANGNFWLSRELSGGMELDEPFNRDMEGAVRGADGEWDIGAYEYVKSKESRPRIENNTLVAPDGSRLRGGTFWIYGWPALSYKTDWALSDAPWNAIRENKLNAVRVACGYRPEREGNYSLDQYEDILEQIIDRAESEGVTVVIDYHPEPGKYYSDDTETYRNNKELARAFWSRIATRFKDRTNIVFELVNEPVFDSPNDYNAELLEDFSELWQLCHEIAPDIPIIVLTFCQVGGHASDVRDWPAERAGWLEGIDWRKTAVGFHSYWRDSSERIVDLKSKYPCINTEYMTYSDGDGMKAMDGYEHHGTLMETLGISWLQWDIIDRLESLDKLGVVIQDLKDKGLYWGDSE